MTFNLINSRQSRKWVFIGIFVLSVFVAFIVAEISLRNAATACREDLVHELSSGVNRRVSDATVWYGGITNRVKNFADADILRLFIAETAEKRKDAERVAEMSQKPDSLLRDDVKDELQSLIRRFLVVRGELLDFIRHSDFVYARILTSDFKTLIATPEISFDMSGAEMLAVRMRMQESMEKIRQDGKIRALPVVCDNEGRLIMPLLVPVYAPDYISDQKNPYGILEVFCDVTVIATRMTSARDIKQGGVASRLLQRMGDGKLQEVRVTGEAPKSLPDVWNAEDALEPRFRFLPNGEEVFSLGIPLSELPWIIEADKDSISADVPYKVERHKVYVLAFTSMVIIALVLIAVWWWLVGRRDRVFATQLAQLYKLVSSQKALLDGINGALADGIILHDTSGNILYVNSSFASMLGKKAEDIVGKQVYTVLHGEVITSLLRHGTKVMQTGSPVLYTEELRLGEQKCYYQISCSPYRSPSGKVIGVVSVFRDIREEVAAQQKAKHTVESTVKALVQAIEAVDPYLCGQALSTGSLAAVIVSRFGMGQDHINTVKTAANLSQIGMIRLPHNLLTKQGLLTREERTQLERHIDYAREILQDIDFGLPVLPAIVQMYERMDGSGYPASLKGEEITPDARILAVANSFCAMVCPRSYRQARSVEDALSILSTPQFDARVVAVLRDYIRTEEGMNFLSNLTAKNIQNM